MADRDGMPVLRPDQATDMFGAGTAAFLDEFCALVERHRIEGAALMILHEGVGRAASVGVHPVARERAKQIAMVLMQMVTTPPSEVVKERFGDRKARKST